MTLKQDLLLLKDINVQLGMTEQRHHIGAVDYLAMQNYSDSNLTSQDSGDRPYVDLETTKEYTIREFSQNIDPTELLWHRDGEDRTIEILECGEGWKFQFEDELPLEIKTDFSIFIPRHEWHRIIKGQGKLKIKIYKNG